MYVPFESDHVLLNFTSTVPLVESVSTTNPWSARSAIACATPTSPVSFVW